MQTVMLEGRGGFDEWRAAARALLLAGIRPERIDWRVKQQEGDDLFGGGSDEGQALPEPLRQQQQITVSPAFLALAGTVVCHTDPARFVLLYRLLWRLQTDRMLLAVVSDQDVSRVIAMEKAIRRDSHKMKAFVRFKEIIAPAGSPAARRRFVAWFEPDHYIVARTAPFFQRRFTDMDWLIATPKGSAAWDGKDMTLSLDPAINPQATDAADDLWRTYFVNIFNPARLKVGAMQSEMPKKYWKNLPEADLIPGLIAGAEARVAAMAARQPSDPPGLHRTLQARAITDE